MLYRLGRAGQPVERYIIRSKAIPGTDIAVGKLNMPVPSDIRKYRLATPADATPAATDATEEAGVVAEAVVVAIQRVYLSPETDTKTGLLRFSELREAIRQGPPPY